MIITNDFVFIHWGKTGGTFVTQSLKKIYSSNYKFLGFNRFQEMDKHGGCDLIPESDTTKPIFSCIRNLYDMYVALYWYGWWATHPYEMFHSVSDMVRVYPNFPDLSFKEYLEATNSFGLVFHDIKQDKPGEIGFLSREFVRLFFKSPESALSRIDDKYVLEKRYKEDMHDVHFLRTERLNSDLHKHLQSLGLKSSKIDFIKREKIIRPKNERKERPSADYSSYFDQNLLNLVNSKEQLVLSIAKDLDSEEVATSLTLN